MNRPTRRAGTCMPANLTSNDVENLTRRIGAGLLLAATLSCEDSLSPNNGDAKPIRGSVRVEFVATGTDADTDGFTLLLDGGQEVNVAPGSVHVFFADLAPGAHTIELRNVAPYCAVIGGNRQTVGVSDGSTAHVPFTVHCLVTGANLLVMTEGLDAAFGEYRAHIDGSLVPTIHFHTETRHTITRIAPGEHSLALTVPANCTVAGANSAVFTVTLGEVVDVPFSVSCVSKTGSVAVTVTATGQDLDVDGFEISTNAGLISSGLVSFGTIVLNAVHTGTQPLIIREMARNCTIAGGTERSITIRAGTTRDTARVAFEVNCVREWAVAFAASRTIGGGYDTEIGVASSDLMHIAFLTRGNSPTWSPDGRQIAYYDPGYCEYYDYDCTGYGLSVISVDGGTPRKLTGDHDFEPDWNRDGKRIVFHRTVGQRSFVYVFDMETMSERPLHSAVHSFAPRWSADGTRIVFGCIVFEGELADLCRIDSDGSGFRRLTNSSAAESSPSWSPDGSRIAFATAFEGKRQIAVMSADGSGLTVIPTDESVGQVTWLRDGRIAFAMLSCDPHGCRTLGLGTINPDGSGKTIVGTSPIYALLLRWRP